MSKVDWHQAEIDYTTHPKLSYGDIAKRYKVAKSTVVRRAKQAKWPARREEFQQKRIKLARETRLESVAETDERHLEKLRIAQDIMSHEFHRLAHKLQNEGQLPPKEARIVYEFIGLYTKAVMAERKILGLNTKPVVLRDPGDIDAYLEAIGLKEPSPLERYNELKETVESIDRLIERRQWLQSMIDDFHT